MAKGTFHAKMGSIKGRNGMDLTEAKDIKRWQEYTEELYKKDLDGVITHLEPYILECDHQETTRSRLCLYTLILSSIPALEPLL